MPEIIGTTGDMKEDWEERAQKNPMYYEAMVEDEKTFWWTGLGTAERVLRKVYPTISHESVLEIGCGMGRVLLYMSRLFEVIYGIDISPTMVDNAREVFSGRKREGNILEFDGANIPLSDNLFDFSYCVFIMEHLPHREDGTQLMREMYRVLKKGGKGLVAVSFPFKPKDSYVGLPSTWAGESWRKEDFLQMLDGIGFKIVDIDIDHREDFRDDFAWVIIEK